MIPVEALVPKVREMLFEHFALAHPGVPMVKIKTWQLADENFGSHAHLLDLLDAQNRKMGFLIVVAGSLADTIEPEFHQDVLSSPRFVGEFELN